MVEQKDKMGTVISIRKIPYNLPRYKDKKGRTITLDVPINTANGKQFKVDVLGELTVFNLILYRSVQNSQSNKRLIDKWSISERTTGLRVCFGRTRQGAVDRVAELVAFYGSESEFIDAVNTATSNYKIA